MTDAALAHFIRLFGPEFGHGKPLETARLARALAALGDPQAKLPPALHIAGSNGKGSTIAFLRAIAEAAGLRVHAFTKPHLLALRERFVLAGAHAEDEALIAAADRVAQAGADLTQFEAQVAAALLTFSETPADLALIETGMGGRDDATNLITPALSLITPVALDHQDALGAALADIAAHKAGIIKPDVPAIVARQQDEARAVIEAAAARAAAPLLRQGQEWDAFASNGRLVVQTETRALDLPLPALAGAHQLDNAGLAVAALLALDHPRIDETAIARGVAQARWPARLEPIIAGPFAQRVHAAGAELWLDGAHNPHAAAALARALADLARRAPRPLALIIGMRARKDARAFIAELAPHAARVLTIPLAEEGADPAALADLARGAGAEAHACASLNDALTRALELGAPRIVATGSLLLARELAS